MMQEIFKRFRKGDDGAVAIEFALIAPLFILGMLSMADIGLAAYDRMKLTNGVRSAAQYVMTGGESADMISAIVIDSSNLDIDGLAVAVVEYCACSGAEETSVDCSTECTDSDITNVYARITATVASHRILSTWNLESSVEVRRR